MGERGASTVSFYCDKCETDFDQTLNRCSRVKIRAIKQEESEDYYQTLHICGRLCKYTNDTPPPEATSRVPTKVVDVGGEKYRFHGRDRMVIPSDLMDVLAEEKRLRDEAERKAETSVDPGGDRVADPQLPEAEEK